MPSIGIEVTGFSVTKAEKATSTMGTPPKQPTPPPPPRSPSVKSVVPQTPSCPTSPKRIDKAVPDSPFCHSVSAQCSVSGVSTPKKNGSPRRGPMLRPLAQKVPAKPAPLERSCTWLPSHPDPRLRSWQCLEAKRLQKLGLPLEHSERYTVVRNYKYRAEESKSARPFAASRGQSETSEALTDMGSPRNEVAPFVTVAKPTCGFFFSRNVNHRKPKLDLTYVDMVKWRSFQRE